MFSIRPRDGVMAQINFSIKDELNKLVEEISNKLGLAKSDYIKSLIIEDLKKYIIKNFKEDGKK